MLRAAVCVVLAHLLVAPAAAHVAGGAGAAAGGWLAGLMHPISGWDHILAMVAVGLWGAQLRQPAVWLLPVAFPMTMALGGFLALIGVHLPGVEIGIALSAIVLGAAVSVAAHPPLAVALTLVAVFAIFHGHAHGAELPAGADALAYSAGFVVATGLLHGAGIALGLLQGWSGGARAVRICGVLIALCGAGFLFAALAG